MHRRSLLLGWLAAQAAAAAAAAPPTDGAAVAAPLRFPRDYGAHPASRTEWWYVTGSLQAGSRLWGFQVTFFRVSTGLAAAGGSEPASRFAPSQLLFAHAALTDLDQRRLRHDQRLARAGFGVAQAGTDDTALVLRDWRLDRAGSPGAASRYSTRVASDGAGFALELQFDTTQPLLLQGDAGLSRKGPAPGDTSRYYSQPQLAASGTLALDGRTPAAVRGRAWLDHEWSDAFVPAGAVGWDWIGINLDDGSALTAFRLRRADGSSLHAGGSWRAAGAAAARSFGPGEVTFTPGRTWASAASRARYPVQWTVDTPAGRFGVNAMLDDQELDSRGSSGAIYWEGLSELVDAAGGQRLGRGYLEMTGYAAALRL